MHQAMYGRNLYQQILRIFLYEAFVPGLAMAARSDLLIHHGGYGLCQTGLYTGTPAVIIPTFSERENNARRVAALGAGDFVLPTTDAGGKKKQVRVEELRAKVRRVLADPAYARNARRIKDWLTQIVPLRCRPAHPLSLPAHQRTLAPCHIAPG